MSIVTLTTVTVRIHPNVTQLQTDVIPPSSSQNAGVMTAQQAAQLVSLLSSRPAIPLTVIPLQNGIATPILAVNMALVPDNTIGLIVDFDVEASDGVNSTSLRTGTVLANVILTANGVFTTSATVPSSVISTTAGPMTVTFAWSTQPGLATLTCTANPSFVPTSLNIKMYVAFAAHPLAVSAIGGVPG